MRSIGWLALFALTLAPTAARADDGDPALRIGGGLGLFTWSAATLDAPSIHQETDQYEVGILSPSLALDVGALVLPWLAFGLYGQGSYSSRSNASSAASESLSYQALAYVEGSFRWDLARPFLRLYGGISGSDTHPTALAAPGALPAGTGTTLTQGAAGGALGAHLFVTPDFSISPYLAAIYLTGDGHLGAPSATTTFSMETISVQLGVAFYGWID